MEPITLGLIALGGLALMKGGSRGGSSAAPIATFTSAQEEKQMMWDLAHKVEAFGALPGFAEFLLPCGYIESRFHPGAQNGNDPNAARGWFGMRPRSAFNSKSGLKSYATSRPNLLKNRAWAVATAADYTRRLVPYGYSGQVVTWRAIRRGWKFPSKVPDDSSDWSQRNWNQFRNAINKTGVPMSMADQRVVVGNLPKLATLAKALGG
jgi:hypothetical protein